MVNTPLAHAHPDELPASGSDVALLVLLQREPSDIAPEGALVILVLDGPGAWVEDLEALAPSYRNVPHDLPNGLFVMHTELSYERDALGEPHDVSFTLLGLSQLALPTREELRTMRWPPHASVEA